MKNLEEKQKKQSQKGFQLRNPGLLELILLDISEQFAILYYSIE